MQLFDDDDYMMTTPKDNFFQIIRSANQNIVENELEKLIERLAVAEKILEERDLDTEYEHRVRSEIAADPGDLENRKNSLFIETVGKIVSQCE